MKILFINQHAGSARHGMEYRPYYLAREWVGLGHEVTIIAADYTHLRKTNPKAADFSEEIIDGIRYVWLKCGVYKCNGIKRALSMLRFAAKLYLAAARIAEKYKPDAVITASTHPFDAYAGWKIAHLAKATYTHEVHDLWPLTLIELGGYSKYHPFIMLMQRAEDFAYKHCGALVSTLQSAREYMVSRGLEPDKFHYICNGVLPELWESPAPLPQDIKATLENVRQKSRFVVGYTGSHARSNALDCLIKAAALIKDSGIHVVLVGDGPEKDALRKLAARLGAGNVTFIDKVDKALIPSLLCCFDALYIGWRRCRLYSYGVSPNKLFDYMMAAKPVIHSVGISDDIVTRAGCGIRVEPEDAQAIASGIRELAAKDRERLEQMGKNGREYVLENFDYKILAQSYLNAISKK